MKDNNQTVYSNEGPSDTLNSANIFLQSVHRRKPSIEEVAEAFDHFLSACKKETDKQSPPTKKVTVVSGPSQSDLAFQLAMTLAKRSHLILQIMQFHQEDQPSHLDTPDIVTLRAAGVPFEAVSKQGNITDEIIEHLDKQNDIAAIVLNIEDLSRHNLLRIQNKITVAIEQTGLPILFSVRGRRIL